MPQDEREAARLFRLSADKGFADAQFAFGQCYAIGRGVPQDFSEAACLSRLAADKGLAVSQADLGQCYAVGKGVPQDEREAARLYRLAADKGHAADQGDGGAEHHLGELLVSGGAEPAVPRQLREGARLLAHAAQQDQDVDTQQAALACLSAHAHERDVMHACCIGCGKWKGLKLCGKCRVAKICGAECTRRMWPVHRPCCKLWVEPQSAA